MPRPLPPPSTHLEHGHGEETVPRGDARHRAAQPPERQQAGGQRGGGHAGGARPRQAARQGGEGVIVGQHQQQEA